ncbi:hypothetical protein LEP1GSC170_0313, partial [Leptospira interrogans serovar Bataviae str. HAI135]
ALDPDRNELKGKAQLARLGIVSNSYFSLEWIRAWNRPLEFNLKQSDFFPSNILQLLESEKEFQQSLDHSSKRWEIIAGKAPIFYDLSWGGILFSLRIIQTKPLVAEFIMLLFEKVLRSKPVKNGESTAIVSQKENGLFASTNFGI